MKNYEEKEKKLENALNKLNSLSGKVVKMSEHIDSLNFEKNQLLSEKEESEENYRSLSAKHLLLKKELEKINKDMTKKFSGENNISDKIDELNQETEDLIDEIEKWQT